MSSDRVTRRTAIILGAALVAVAVAAILVVVSLTSASEDGAGPKPAQGETLAGERQANELFDGIPQKANTLGKKSAPVTLIEFADLQCPACAQFAQQGLPPIVQDFVRTGKLRLEIRTMTFLGPESLKAARAAAAAGDQNREWQFTSILYANQGIKGQGWVTDELLNQAYEAAGVDVAEAQAYAKSPKSLEPAKKADEDARELGIQATPSFAIGTAGGPYAPVDASILSSPEGLGAAIDSLSGK